MGQTLAWAAVRPRVWGYRLMSHLVGREQAFAKAAEGVAHVPGWWGLCVRQAFYRATLRYVGRDVHFGYGTVLSKTDAVIGPGVFLGRYCVVGRVTLGRGVLVADGVQLLSGRHHHSGAGGEKAAVKTRHIRIGRGAWIGGGSVVMNDVGKSAIVGAGAVVVKKVTAGDVVGGSPAGVLRSGSPLYIGERKAMGHAA